MAKIAKKPKCYPSDLTDEEWSQIAPLMPMPGRRGRPREIKFREVINAVRYLVRSGVAVAERRLVHAPARRAAQPRLVLRLRRGSDP